MGALVGLSTLAFILVGGAVGARLLLLARRTRQVPETALGVGLFTLAGVCYPASLLAQLATGHEPVVRAAALVSAVMLSVGCSATIVFTWKVYRPDASWARSLAWSGFVAWGLLVVSGLPTIFGGPVQRLFEINARFLLRQGLMLLTMLWSAVESLRYHGQMRRRLSLGLADVVVVDRVLLWAISSALSMLTAAAILGAALVGVNPLQAPAVELVIAAGGIGASVVLLLAFMPPQAYLARVRRRAGQPAAG